MLNMRVGRVERTTAETSITLSLGLDGEGKATIETGIGFFDHMLAQVAKHGLLDLEVHARGDIHVDMHHTVEDVGICMGQALVHALRDGAGIRRFGHAVAPLDEALVLVALDICGRGSAHVDLALGAARIGAFEGELVPEFFRGLAANGGVCLHVRQLAGTNSHHIAEAAFKGLGLALRDAVAIDPRRAGVPSTKGSLL
ncbi:MAG: imidazoleglycerol-phosphate dehydratase HisB [Anaerolineae bacterium]